MVNIAKIKLLTKEKGWSLSYLCRKIELSNSYFADVSNGKTKISDERLNVIAELLNTTPEYLRDESEQKEKAGSVKQTRLEYLNELYNGLNDEEKEEFVLKYVIKK